MLECNMPFILFFLFILFTGNAWSDPTMHVLTNHEQLNAKDFQVKGVQIQEDKVDTKSQLIARELREQFILKSNLHKQAATWDEFEKDILLLRVEHLTTADLSKQYPNLPTGSLQKLKTLIYNYRKNATNN